MIQRWRSLIFVVAALILLAGGFALYQYLIPPPASPLRPSETVPSTLPSEGGVTDAPLQGGDQAWVNMYDRKTGRFYGRFRAVEYLPQPDGTFKLTQPQGEFFEPSGQVIFLRGKSGVARFGNESHGGLGNAPSSIPSQGTLQDVRVQIYPSVDAYANRPGHPDLTITMPIASFDSDLLRLFTPPYVDRASNQLVQGDQVPVHVRGNLEFDGKGLILYWSDLTHELKTLHIDHGHRLYLPEAQTSHAGGEQRPAVGPVGTSGITPAAARTEKPAEVAARPADETSAPPMTAAPTQASVPPIETDTPVLENQTPPLEGATGPATAPTTAPAPGPTIYLASFQKNVRVLQSGQERVTADVMNVKFVMQSASPDTRPSTPVVETPNSSPPINVRPSPAAPAPLAPAPLPAGTSETAHAVEKAAANVATAAVAQMQPTTRQTIADASPSAPKTQPSQGGPLEVFWTGPLDVAIAPPPTPKLHSGQYVVQFQGEPVHLHQPGMDAVGSHVQYNTANGVATIEGTPQKPLVLKRLRGDGVADAVITGQRAHFSEAKNVAMMEGVGQGTFSDPTQANKIMRAAWDKSCTLLLDRLGASQVLRRAEIVGHADLLDTVAGQPPQMHLTGNEIDTDFTQRIIATNPKSLRTNTDLKRLTATGDVHCLTHDANQQPRILDSQQLIVETALDSTGKTYPRYVQADGKVHAADATQDLRSDHLDATLAPAPPTTRPATQPVVEGRPDDSATTQPILASAVSAPGVSEPASAAPPHHRRSPDASSTQPSDLASGIALRTMLATGNVVVHGNDGATASGDALHVEMVDDKPVVTLVGQPPAEVISKGNILRGTEIDVKPKDDWANIPCPGTIDAVESPASGGSGRPLHLAWDQRALMDGNRNLVNLFGNVAGETRDTSSAVETTHADHMVLNLIDAPPTTRPTTRPTARPAKRPASPDSGTDFGPTGNKQVRQVTLLDRASVNSVLNGPDGKILRREHITSQRIEFYPADKLLVVPVTGRMLIEDHTAPTTRPQAQQTETSDSVGGSRGITAFQWNRQFTFDQISNVAQMDGKVVIINRPDNSTNGTVTIRGDEVVAHFAPDEPVKKPAGTTTRPATQPTDDTPPMKLISMDTTGNVRINLRTQEIDAASVHYDPSEDLLIARGRDGVPVTVIDAADRGTSQFSEIWLNTRTNRVMKVVDLMGGGSVGH